MQLFFTAVSRAGLTARIIQIHARRLVPFTRPKSAAACTYIVRAASIFLSVIQLFLTDSMPQISGLLLSQTRLASKTRRESQHAQHLCVSVSFLIWALAFLKINRVESANPVKMHYVFYTPPSAPAGFPHTSAGPQCPGQRPHARPRPSPAWACRPAPHPRRRPSPQGNCPDIGP